MPKERKSTKLNAYILLDRSASMGRRWEEALSSINTYVEGIAKAPSRVTLATFDEYNGLPFDVIRDAVPAKEWKNVTKNEAGPRGSTPLLDAIGRVVALAEKADQEKTVIVVMTDGEENCSREVKKDEAKKMLDRCKEKKWQVVFLGADFDAFGQSASVGVGRGQTMTMDSGNYVNTMTLMASQSLDYTARSIFMNFTEKDRAVASGKVKPSDK